MNKIILIILIFFMAGCSLKNQVEQSVPILVTIKTSKIKIADSGFLKSGNKFLNLQIFNGGSLVLNLKKTKKICINNTCMASGAFNKEFFGYEHYENIIEEILFKKPLYDGKNLINEDNGFKQELKIDKKFHIFYFVNPQEVDFIDTINKIKIKIIFI